MMNASEAVRIMEGPDSWGSVPAGIQRELLSLMEPQLDWRTILNDFVQEAEQFDDVTMMNLLYIGQIES